MRKNVFGRRLKRDVNQRKALFKSLLSALVLEERIKTTEPKAKAVKGQADKLITTAKKNTTAHYSLLSLYLTPPAIKKIVSEVAPRFVNRQGGYTRIIRLGKRRTDSASMVYLEWVEKGTKIAVVKQKSESNKGKISKQTQEDLAELKKLQTKKEQEVIEAEIVTEKEKPKKKISKNAHKTEKKLVKKEKKK